MMSKGYRKHHPIVKNITQSKPIPDIPTFMAFTQVYEGISNRLESKIGLTPPFDPKDYPDSIPFPITEKVALWDTGATSSVLTSATVKELKLTPIGTTTLNHAGGSDLSNTYLVNFFLPNHVLVYGVVVSECKDIAGNFGAIIGMDIITRGDFSITNFENQTCLSFRFPSKKQIDYVAEFQHHRGK